MGQGVPPQDILLEEAATNLMENFLLSDALLLPLGVQRTLVVTKPQTQRRAKLTALQVGKLAGYSFAAPLRSFTTALDMFGPERVVNEMVGDVDRMLQYPARGFMRAEPLPQAVLEAFESLRRAGFEQNCLAKP